MINVNTNYPGLEKVFEKDYTSYWNLEISPNIFSTEIKPYIDLVNRKICDKVIPPKVYYNNIDEDIINELREKYIPILKEILCNIDELPEYHKDITINNNIKTLIDNTNYYVKGTLISKEYFNDIFKNNYISEVNSLISCNKISFRIINNKFIDWSFIYELSKINIVDMISSSHKKYY